MYKRVINYILKLTARKIGVITSHITSEATKIKLVKRNYPTLSQDILKQLIFEFSCGLLKNYKKNIFVHRKFNVKSKTYKLKLDLKTFLGRYYYYTTPNKRLKFLIEQLLTKKSNYIDVGANIGQTSLMAACLDINVTAFEPVPQIFKNLKANIQLNNLKNIKTYMLAISNKNENKQIAICSDNDGAHSLSKSFQKASGKNYSKMISIKAKKFDSLKLNADMVKIDVEGHELEALEGMEKSLKNIKYILCETTNQNFKKVVDYLTPNFEYIEKYTRPSKSSTMDLLFVNKKLDLTKIKKTIRPIYNTE
jgi:FkbM family methyltransferase